MITHLDDLISELQQYNSNKPIKLECNGIYSEYFDINVSWTVPDFYYTRSIANASSSSLSIHAHDERFKLEYSKSFYKRTGKKPMCVGDVLHALYQVNSPLDDITVFHFSSDNSYEYESGNVYDFITLSNDGETIIMHIKTKPFPIEDGFHTTNELPIKDVYAQPFAVDNYPLFPKFIVYGPVLDETGKKVLYVSSMGYGAGWIRYKNKTTLYAYFLRQKYKRRSQASDGTWNCGYFNSIDVKKWKYIN